MKSFCFVYSINLQGVVLFRVVILAFFSQVIVFVRSSSKIERLMSINTVIPVMILRFVRTHRCFVSIDIEYNSVNCFQIFFKPFLECISWWNPLKVDTHFCQILRLLTKFRKKLWVI